MKDLDLRMNSSLVESEICAKMIGNGCMPIEIESVPFKKIGNK